MIKASSSLSSAISTVSAVTLNGAIVNVLSSIITVSITDMSFFVIIFLLVDNCFYFGNNFII